MKTVVPVGYGFVGLILAGLICAIFSAIYSMMNSVSTMMAFDVFRKYINPQATDKQTVRFGQSFVILMCILATFLANTTYDPSSSDNFFITLAKQTSYIKPGLVIVFFWGILWKKTNPTAAVVVLVFSPIIGLGCDFLYENLLVHYDWVKETFGEKFNFLYRVFLIFVLGSVLIVFLSKLLNTQKEDEKEQDLTVPVSGVFGAILRFTILQLPIFLLVIYSVITPQLGAFPASMLTLGLFVWYYKKEISDVPFYQSDIFYAGILTGTMVWIMYYFA